MLVYLNGRVLEKASAAVSVDDRGFLFGDGVYEVIRVCDGRPFEAGAHLGRLAAGVAALEIPGLPPGELPGLLHVALELVERNALARGDATIYVQVTRGAAPRTHAFPPASTPATIYIATAPLTRPHALHEHGAAAITTPDVRWARCDIKSVNLLPNVLAKQQAVQAGAAEAIFVRDGAITDAASSNVFAVIDDELRTPPLTNYLLPGVTRRVVLDLAAELGLAVREQPIFVRDLPRAAELFVTATTVDVLPVRQLDGRAIGAGVPGPITRRLQAAFAERLAGAVRASAA
jgi:D-alanine transaminase